MKRIARRYIKLLEQQIKGYGPELPYLSPFDNDWQWGVRNEWVQSWKEWAIGERKRLLYGGTITREEIKAKAEEDIATYKIMMKLKRLEVEKRPNAAEYAEIDRELKARFGEAIVNTIRGKRG